MQFKTLAEDHRLDLQLGGGELGGDFLDDVLSGGYEHYCIPFYIDVKAPKPLKIKLKITLIYFYFPHNICTQDGSKFTVSITSSLESFGGALMRIANRVGGTSSMSVNWDPCGCQVNLCA